MSFKNLLQRQWVGYGATHQNRTNLSLHLIAVPLFMIATLVAFYGLVMLSPLSLIVATLGYMVSLLMQGRGHKREPVQPEPFTSAWDFMSRIVAEQWMTFPRFVLTGGWLKNNVWDRFGEARANRGVNMIKVDQRGVSWRATAREN